ncbi:MAG: penicillin-binding protein 1C [Myxococcota bacterium]
MEPRRSLLRGLLGLLGLGIGFLLVPVPRFSVPWSPVVTGSDGRVLSASVADDEQWRFPPDQGVPERYAKALVAFEDQRFWSHPGVDPLAIGRALVTNVQQGRVVSGASTLTMQVVRLSRSNPPRTLFEKVVEMGLALRLDLARTKAEILALHAAHAPFGGNTVGLRAASERYFRRPPQDLSWAEAATLAILPHSPGLIHPGRGRDALRTKRNRLLSRLAEQGTIAADDARLAKLEPLPRAPDPVPRIAPHVMDRLLAASDSTTTPSFATTLRSNLQAQVTKVAERHARQLVQNGVHNLAVLVADTRTGAVLAYVGNVDVKPGDHGQHVDVVTARRSTGSVLKPLLYAEMVQAGELLPSQIVPDVPLRIGGFSPENFDRGFLGALPADVALARSRNVPAVWMLQRHGVLRFHRELVGWGLTTLDRPAGDYGLSLVLGGAESTLWDLVGAYRTLGLAALAADEPRPPLHVRGAPKPVPPTRKVDPMAAYVTLQALREVKRPGELGAWTTFSSTRPIAWKTGTSHGFRDAWAVGVTPSVAIGVWVGNADGEGRPDLVGVRAAAPVLFDVLRAAPDGGWFEDPGLGTTVQVCADSGMRAGPDCDEVKGQRGPTTMKRAAGCQHCQRIHCVDEDCTARGHADCRPTSALHDASWFVLPAAQAHFTKRQDPSYRPLPPWAPECTPDDDGIQMGILEPKRNARVHVPIELDGKPGRLVLQGTHLDPSAVLYWHLDERYLGQTSGVHQLEVWPGPGDHVITVVDQTGDRIERRFTVIEVRTYGG